MLSNLISSDLAVLPFLFMNTFMTGGVDRIDPSAAFLEVVWVIGVALAAVRDLRVFVGSRGSVDVLGVWWE